jgi:hypothetical protein
MAWTNIDDTFLEPGKPLRSADLIALRDNAVAIAQGLSGAPKVTNNAFDNLTIGAEKLKTSTTERDWVLARAASSALAAVGTYTLLVNFPAGVTAPGAVQAGGNLRYSDSAGNYLNTALAGSWRCMGNAPLNGSVTVWLRIA